MAENTRKRSVSSSRTIFINPLYTNSKARELNGATNIGKSNHLASSVHINPLFLSSKRSPAIHMNPKFLQSKLLSQSQVIHADENRNSREITVSSDIQISRTMQPTQLQKNILNPPKHYDKLDENSNQNVQLTGKKTQQKIISKSRTKIIREPATVKKVTHFAAASFTPSGPLIRLSSKKLVRQTHLSLATTARAIAPSTSRSSSVSAVGKYKLDRRLNVPSTWLNKKHLTPKLRLKGKTFVARYAWQRSSQTKINLRSSELQSSSVNKILKTININGVLYKSTRNKLQRKDASLSSNLSDSKTMPTLSKKLNSEKNSKPKKGKTPYGRVLFVCGTKFVLDKNGFKLTRMGSESQRSANVAQNEVKTSQSRRQRIDIGGLTYINSTTDNVFVRTSNHLTLAHLNMAKYRSLQLLTRRLVKSNIPCAIFQRIGKCKALERGKCNKVHNKDQVTICPRFLRNECTNDACLLSHNMSLAKMPVCRFYLKGVCVRSQCPYLHKKLSMNTDVCTDFLRGYCKLAELCNKRHEFVCPEYSRIGKCELLNCKHCKRRRKNEKMNVKPNKILDKTSKEASPVEELPDKNSESLRYFADRIKNRANTKTNTEKINYLDQIKEDFSQVEEIDSDSDIPRGSIRPKVGALPAFIPLS